MGLHSFQGDNAKNLGPGLRLGALIGGHFADSLSGSIELTVDSLNFENMPSGAAASGMEVNVLLAPLFHMPVASAQMVLGPKGGYFHGSSSASYTLGPRTNTVSISANGWVAGAHAGVFAPIREGVSLGGLAGFEYGKTLSCSASIGTCNSGGSGSKVVSLVGAALF
jgi:hypothetical protein